ncbi:MAG TPA: DUF2231 domain-containing protein [Flavitalea sp.]|nr:DUF2231 domain-containing protein [Flavitalea sp.]
MKSRANLKGHPIHPMLIPFPVAFFTGTLICDILGFLNNDTNFWNIGQWLIVAGIIGALLAAIPGLIDYFGTVPPDSSAKKRATTHGLTNVTMLIIFCIAAYYRRGENASAALVIGLEAAGFILMSIAGWMGATLVYRNQIGVDPRYAHAGKWKEETIKASDKPLEVATKNELKVNQMKLLHVGDKRIVVARTEKGYVAFDDRCTHKGGSLAGGAMICGTVQCPWHGSQFDVNNGTVAAGPAKDIIGVYKIYESEEKIYLEL